MPGKMKKSAILLSLAALLAFAGCGSRHDDEREPTVDTVPMLVTQVQKCSRLYTSEYRLRKIVVFADTMSVRGSLLQKDFRIDLPLGQRRIAIPVTASVKAYVDFSEFSEKNIRRHGSKIEIVLPDPQIVMTSTQIDHKGVRQKVSLLRSNFSDEEITRIQRQGRDDMVRSMPQLGIIENARRSAARQLVPIFTQMGYQEGDITISFRKEFTLDDLPALIRGKEI